MSRVTSAVASVVHGVQLLGTLFILTAILARLRSPPASLVSTNPSLPDVATCRLSDVASDTALCDAAAAVAAATWVARAVVALLACLTCCFCCVPDVLDAAADVGVAVVWTVIASVVSAEGQAGGDGGWTWERGVLVAAWVVVAVSTVGALVALVAACGWCFSVGGGRRRRRDENR
ncbi:hypothetical protein MMPV_008926 [Pyropia vietnamensis]